MDRIPIRRVIDPRRVNNFLDTCAFDPKYAPEDVAARRMRALHQAGEVHLILAHSNQKEVAHPNTPADVKKDAIDMNHTLKTGLTSSEVNQRTRIHAILTGNGKPENTAADAAHVFEAGKYGAHFITTDARILAAIIVLPSEWLKAFHETAD
jgi:hypothetical protein